MEAAQRLLIDCFGAVTASDLSRSYDRYQPFSDHQK
jgi:hypothetical protein